MSDTKPCPFCQSKNIQMYPNYAVPEESKCRCIDCGATGYLDFWNQRPDLRALELELKSATEQPEYTYGEWMPSTLPPPSVMTSDGIYVLDITPVSTPNEWISVETQLPEENIDCLVYRVNRGFSPTNVVITQYGKYGFEIGPVTHWMPLPAPPITKDDN